MTDFLITMMTLYSWFTWLLVFLAAVGVGYGSLWLTGGILFVSSWVQYRRAVWQWKGAVRRPYEDGSHLCSSCAAVADKVISLTDDPPEYQHPDGDEYGPGKFDYCDHDVIRWTCTRCAAADDPDDPEWLENLAEALDKKDGDEPAADDSSDPWGRPWCYENDHGIPGHGPHERHAHIPDSSSGAVVFRSDGQPYFRQCRDPGCEFYGWVHPPPCKAAPGPAMPPVPWSGQEASLPLHPAIVSDLEAAGFGGHDYTEDIAASAFTAAEAAEVREMTALMMDGIIPPGEVGKGQENGQDH